jgi:hypothetical protein
MTSFRRYRWVLIAFIVVGGVVFGLREGLHAWRRHTYPFGSSHCCDKGLMLDLYIYAEKNGGAFPAGEVSPEASLSLIHTPVADRAELLCGKSGKLSLTRELLDRGELLDASTCGWNYVEGLRADDDPRLALFWDKEGLGHNGQRLRGGGHIVMRLSGFSEHVVATEWQSFLDQQRQLLMDRINGEENRVDAIGMFGGEKIHVQLRVVDTFFIDAQVFRNDRKSSGRTVAFTETRGQPNEHIVPTESLRNAEVIIQTDKQQIHFLFPVGTLIFDNEDFFWR